MGKRSNFDRKPRDFYPTPMSAVLPLLPFIEGQFFYEPCAGKGDLVDHLKHHGIRCTDMSDIVPLRNDIMPMDAMDYQHDSKITDVIITNPPWERRAKIEVDGKNKILPDEEQPLLMLIEHFRKQTPTWLLIDADFMHNVQSAKYMKYCSKVVSVGRVKWIEGSKSAGKENCCWYLFGDKECDTIFYERQK